MITFKLAPHTLRPDTTVVELWYHDRLIGQITPGDPQAPTLRIISKYSLNATLLDQPRATPVQVLAVTIGPSPADGV